MTTKEDCSSAAHHGHLPRTGHHRVQSNPGLRAEPKQKGNMHPKDKIGFGSKSKEANVTMVSTRVLISNASHAETSLDAFGFNQLLNVFRSPQRHRKTPKDYKVGITRNRKSIMNSWTCLRCSGMSVILQVFKRDTIKIYQNHSKTSSTRGSDWCLVRS